MRAVAITDTYFNELRMAVNANTVILDIIDIAVIRELIEILDNGIRVSDQV